MKSKDIQKNIVAVAVVVVGVIIGLAVNAYFSLTAKVAKAKTAR